MPTLTELTTATLTLDTLARRAPASDDLLVLADWLGNNGHTLGSAIERIELAEQLITRRRFLIGMGTLVLAGCGTPGASAPTAMVAATRQITDDLGRVVDVPAEPQRVVVLDPSRSTVHLVELGLTPLAATHNESTGSETGLFPAILGDAAKAITSVGLSGAANLEQITALRPDLILYNMPFEEIDVNLLAAIAPTVAYNFDRPYEEHLRFIAGVVGRTTQAEALITDFERQLDERARTLQLNGRTFSLLWIADGGDGFGLAGPESLLGRAIVRLGGTIVPSSVNGKPLTDDTDRLSLEVLPQLVDADTIIALRSFGSAEAEQDTQSFLSSPVWQAIPAVQREDVLIVDIQAVAGTYGYRGLNAVLDELAAKLQR
jgi:iron complex transport system substrate-binding protein